MSDEENHEAEREMREAKVPYLKTEEELLDYIRSLVDRQHDYGTCVYAMSMSAVAALNYVASKLGVTGFQASCADLDILRRTRHIDHFMIVDFDKALFPQYDLRAQLNAALEEAAPRLAVKAREKLAEAPDAHPSVVAHWRMLAAANPETRKDLN